MIIRKKVSFVKSKGGEFALKVTLNLHARKYIEKIRLIDRLPPLVKLYEKFGIEKPIRTDEKNKRIEWAFEKLEARFQGMEDLPGIKPKPMDPIKVLEED